MRAILSERNIVVLLFVMVLVTFSLAQEDSKKMEKMFTETHEHTASRIALQIQSATLHTAKPSQSLKGQE
jgi:hypothetical protein